MDKRLNFEALKVPRVSVQNKTKTLHYIDSETSRFFKTAEENKNEIVSDPQVLHIRSIDQEMATKESQNRGKDFMNLKISADSSKNIIIHKELSTWSPENWEQHLNNIKLMRQNHTAPIDVMGCHKCADEAADGPIYRFQLLIALMLSSQTKDHITHSAMLRLREVNCIPEIIVSISDEELGKIIYPVSFWKRKVQYLKQTSKILLQKFHGDIPNNVKELCYLPGVGPKIAHICMQVAWNEISGIGVDTHVHRISNRLRWVPEPTKTPEKTRVVLESWLPKELWKDINYLFVGFGQEICRPQRPECLECLNKIVCPFATNKYQF